MDIKRRLKTNLYQSDQYWSGPHLFWIKESCTSLCFNLGTLTHCHTTFMHEDTGFWYIYMSVPMRYQNQGMLISTLIDMYQLKSYMLMSTPICIPKSSILISILLDFGIYERAHEIPTEITFAHNPARSQNIRPG